MSLLVMRVEGVESDKIPRQTGAKKKKKYHRIPYAIYEENNFQMC